MTTEKVTILDGNTFVVTDRRGDIDASLEDPLGLFLDDSRFLSKWVLLVDDRRPNVLSIETLNYYEVLNRTGFQAQQGSCRACRDIGSLQRLSGFEGR